MRCCWMSSRSSTVGGGVAAVPNCACNARTCSVRARFSCSNRSSRSKILARSGAVCAHKVAGARHSARQTKLVRPAIEKLLQFPAHQRRRKRLREECFHSQRRNSLRSCRVRIGAYYDDRHTREPLVRPHPPDQLVPVHARHIQVGDHHPYRPRAVQYSQALPPPTEPSAPIGREFPEMRFPASPRCFRSPLRSGRQTFCYCRPFPERESLPYRGKPVNSESSAVDYGLHGTKRYPTPCTVRK